MAIYFLDSSALVKRYISEIGSSWVLGLFDPALNNEIFIAAITRRSRGGSISMTDAAEINHQFRLDALQEYQIIEITEGIIDSGMRLAETYGLRGYDAIQLAAGCTINSLCLAHNLPAITFVLADNELNLAVLSEGLLIENPQNYSY